MRELLATGFMSNRGRQNVASFLARDGGIDWRLGAEWMEVSHIRRPGLALIATPISQAFTLRYFVVASQATLIDHDPTSNWGNWAYVAGVGADPREDRYFLIPKQAREYDGHGDYTRLWVPELAAAPTSGLHDPRELPRIVRQGSQGYPEPVVRLLAWSTNASGGNGGARGRGTTGKSATGRSTGSLSGQRRGGGVR